MFIIDDITPDGIEMLSLNDIQMISMKYFKQLRIKINYSAKSTKAMKSSVEYKYD